jgi:hypothetical protein
MDYRDRNGAVQGTQIVAQKIAQNDDGGLAAGRDATSAILSASQLADANINPTTGLATDYLNHFNEAIMLLEMVATCPDCVADFHDWRPLSYREHFQASRFKGRELAIAAYDAADPAVRHCLDNLASTMTTVIEATRATMTPDLAPDTAAALADRAAAWLKLLVARAGAVINGRIDTAEADAPQTVVDGLMRRSA